MPCPTLEQDFFADEKKEHHAKVRGGTQRCGILGLVAIRWILIFKYWSPKLIDSLVYPFACLSVPLREA